MKLTRSENHHLVERLISWFRTTKRDLPWRKTYDPYHVWISEIMLQQTQMDRGVRYFNRWVERFPSVWHVAEALEDEILQHWEGLGYYARARNLHKAAREIVANHSGVVPADYETLLTLPGIGPYTAAAVASIAGNQDIAVIDANVNRILARILDLDQPVKSQRAQSVIKSTVENLLPTGSARVFNQALMDFGGLVCTPKRPTCEVCVIQELCIAYSKNTVTLRPVVHPPKKIIGIERYVALIICDGKVYMEKRTSGTLWKGLWDLPGVEYAGKSVGNVKIQLIKGVKGQTGLHIVVDDFLETVQHQYTHHKITLHSYLCSIDEGDEKNTLISKTGTGRWLSFSQMDRSPCPSGVRKIIECLKIKKPEWFHIN